MGQQPGSKGGRRDRRLTGLNFIREQFSLPGLEAWSTSTRTVLLNALFLVTLVVVVPIVVAQFPRGTVVIEPITVPAALAEQGMTPEVVASRLWDGIEEVKKLAATSKTSIDAIPSAQQVEFSFPDSGISIESLVFHLRRMFNAYETRIAGEITCTEPTCSRPGLQMRLRVMREGVDVVNLPAMGTQTELAYFQDAAQGVLGYLDPFVAMASLAGEEPVRAVAIGYRHINNRHPDAKWFYDRIGRIHADEGEVAKAVKEFQAALDLDDGFNQARAALAEALLRSGDTAGAARELERIRRRDPDDVAMLETMSKLAKEKGEADEAVKLLLRAAELRPDELRFLAEAGRIELAQGRRPEGEELLQRVLQVDPGDLLAFNVLAASDMASRNYEAAEKLFRNAADFKPDDPASQAAHGNVLALLHRWEPALTRYSRALELDPRNNNYAVQTARCLQALGQDEKALAALHMALDREPGNVEIFRLMADSLRTLGRKAEAVAAYRKFLELDKPDPTASEAEKVLAGAQRDIVEGWIRVLTGPEAGQ